MQRSDLEDDWTRRIAFSLIDRGGQGDRFRKARFLLIQIQGRLGLLITILRSQVIRRTLQQLSMCFGKRSHIKLIIFRGN